MRFFCLPVKAFQSTIFKYQKLKIIFPPQCLFILLMPILPFMYALHLFHLYILTSPSQKEKKKFHACGWKIETWAHTHIWIFLFLSVYLAVLYTKHRSTATAAAVASSSLLSKKWNLTPNYSSMYSFSTCAFIFFTAPLFLPLPLHDHPL